MEFVVNSKFWKTFYRMSLRGDEKDLERMIKFAFIVDATIMLKLGELFKKLEADVDLDGEIKSFEDLKKLAQKKARSLKNKDLRKLFQFYLIREALSEMGLKNFLSKREVAEMIKKKI